MKIHGGDGYYDIVVEFEDGDSDQLKRIMRGPAAQALQLFADKNRGYRQPLEQDYSLGARGEFVEVHRKTGKLHRGVWDGDQAVFESESRETVVNDMIGHLLLMLDAWSRES